MPEAIALDRMATVLAVPSFSRYARRVAPSSWSSLSTETQLVMELDYFAGILISSRPTPPCSLLPDDMTIAYFFSPFTGAVFRRVIDNIEVIVRGRSLKRLWVVLVRPTVGPSADLYRANDDYLKSRAWLSRVADIETKTWAGWATVTSFYKLASDNG